MSKGHCMMMPFLPAWDLDDGCEFQVCCVPGWLGRRSWGDWRWQSLVLYVLVPRRVAKVERRGGSFT